MQHYAPTHDVTHPWRTRTMIVTAIAVVELLALVAVAVVLLGRGWFESARATAVRTATHQRAAAAAKKRTTASTVRPKPHPKALARPMLARAHTSLIVLNGNGRDGAAGAEATILRSHGYPVEAVGNAKRSDYAASIVMYRPGYEREARRLARDVGISIVSGLDGVLPSQLHGARLLIIVGS
jgi:hypothetical protein